MKLHQALFSVAAVFVLATGLRPASAATMYHVTDLGTLGGALSSGNSINNSGVVVGSAQYDGSGRSHAFVYSNGVMTDLGTLPGGGWSGANAINDSGLIVGYSFNSSSVARAAQFLAGAVIDRGALPGGTSSSALAISNSGDFAGDSDTNSSGSLHHAFRYQGGTLTDLGALPGKSLSQANGMNNVGQIVGTSWNTGHTNARAFLYSTTGMTNLGTLGGNSSAATDVNDVGQVVGNSTPSTGFEHAFLYDGTLHDLGVLPGGDFSDAYGINNVGQIVGQSRFNGAETAFLYENGTMFNLNQRLDSAGAGWSIATAYGINDHGWITGIGYNPNGQQHAYLLVPVSEPTSGALIVVGWCALWACRRLRRPLTVPVAD